MKISTKLLGVAVGLLVLLLIENGLNTQSTREIEQDSAHHRDFIIPLTSTTTRLTRDVEQLAGLTSKPEPAQTVFAGFQQDLQEAQALIHRGVSLHADDREGWLRLQQDLEQIADGLTVYESSWALSIYHRGTAPAQWLAQVTLLEHLVDARLRPAVQRFQENLPPLLEAEVQRVKATADQHMARQNLITLVLCGLVLIVTLSLFRSVVRPLRELARTAHAIASGNRTLRIAYRARDELGVLAAAINRMLDNLRASTVSRQELEAVVQKRTEELKTVNARLDFLLSASPATVFATLPEPPFTTTFISSNQVKMLGYSPEEFIASPSLWAGLIHPDDRERVLRESHEVQAQGYYRHDYQFRHKSGAWRWLRSERRMVHDAEGRPREIIGCVTDVTVEKQAMARQDEYRLRLDLALSATSISTWDNDVAQKRVVLDAHWAAMLGAPAVEIVTTNRALLSLVHPEDRGAMLKAVRQIQKVSTDSYQVEHRVRRTDGQWLWIQSRGRVISRDATGRPTRIIGTNTDITTRKLAELALTESRAQLELALQSAGLGVWRWEVEADAWALDAQAKRMLGADPKSGPQATEAFLQRVHPDDRAIVRDAIDLALQKDGGYEAVYRVVLPGGEIRHLADRGRLARNPAGRPLHLHGVMRDVTSAKTAERILREAAQHLTKMFMAAPAATSLSELDSGQFIDVNERFVELTQRPRRVLIGHNWNELGLWRHAAEAARIQDLIQREGRVDYEEVGLIRPDGSPLDVGISIAVVEVGQRRCALTCVLDLTSRNQAIAALRDREKLISSINTNLRGTWLYRMVFRPDGPMTFSYVSPNIEHVMGIDAGSLLADSANLFALMHPDDLPVLKRVLEHEQNTGGATSITLRTLHPDGRQCWMQFRSQHAEKRADGSHVRDGIVTDVTAARMAQIKLAAVGERLELALRSSRTCTWLSDLAAGHITLDPAWQEMLGGEPRETIATARQIVDLAHPEDRASAHAAMRRVTRHQADRFAVELRVRTNRGEYIWVRSLGRVTERDRQGHALRLVGTNTDITSLKQAETKVRQQAEFLASLHRTTLDLLNRRNLPDLFKALVERASTLLNAPLAEILLKENETLAVHASTTAVVSPGGSRHTRREAPLCWQAMDEGRIVTVPGYANHPKESPSAPALVRSAIALPILRGDERLGVLYLARREAHQPFTEEDIQRGDMLANKVALILHNAHARAEATREAELRTTDLRLSEERFRRIFDHSPYAIIIYSLADTRFVDANQAALKLLGTTRDQMIGRKSKDLGHWVNESDRWHYLGQLMNHGRAEGMEAPFRSFDGTIFTGLVSGSVIQLNEQPHVLSVLLDITELKQADLARARSLAMLQATLEATADGILAVTNEGHVEAYNRTFADMWRLPASLLETRDNAQLLAAGLQQVVDPDSFAPLRRHLEEHPLESSSDLMQLRDGRVLERFSQPMLVDRQPIGRVWSYRDITKRLQAENARRESEERFRGVFDHSPTAIALLSIPDGQFLQFNQATATTFQYSAEEIHGHTSTELGIWANLADRHRYLTLLQEHHLALDFEAPMRRKDGSPFTALFNGTLVNIGGQPFSLNSIQDITARKAAETRLADSLREKELLLREIHHRVKNNLQIISSLLHFQAKKAGNERELSLFRDGQNRLRAMILVHEKLYRSKDLNRVNLGDYVRGLTEQLQHTFREQRATIQLRANLDPIPAPVEIALPCGMIVTELVTNAFKYAFTSGSDGVVGVDLVRTPEGFTLSVRDNGKGMPDGFNGQGDSFGLQLVNNLAEQLDARLTYRRAEGTEVTLEVPFSLEVSP